MAKDVHREPPLKGGMSAMKESRGFTMIEMVVVLAVIAILAAILTPIVTSYVDRARTESAQNDVKKIAASLVQFNTDTKLWPIYSSVPTNISAGAYSVEAGPGIQPIIGSGTNWPSIASAGSLDSVLNQNLMGLPTTGKTAWKGPYVELGPDPWGTQYFVNSLFLEPGCLSTHTGSGACAVSGGTPSAVYVISAGPNQTIETNYDVATSAPFSIGGDDILVRIK
jgi:prepilin-type N-terminal cleavage/methylation domain-containing protein